MLICKMPQGFPHKDFHWNTPGESFSESIGGKNAGRCYKNMQSKNKKIIQ